MIHPLAILRKLLADLALGAATMGEAEYLMRRAARRLGVASLGVDGRLGFFQGGSQDIGVLRGYLRSGDWAPEVQDLLSRVLRGGGTLIDVGANIGLTSIPAARMDGVACYAFEPDPENFRYLVANVAANRADRVRVFPMAAMAEEGTLQLERSADNMGDHRVRRGAQGGGVLGEDQRKVVQVEGRRLDAVLAGETLAAPIVLKVDTQGAEVQVLKGAGALLDRVDVVILEFWPYGLRRMGDGPEGIYQAISRFSQGALIDEGPGPSRFAGHPPRWLSLDALLAALRDRVPADPGRIDWCDLVVTRRPIPADGASPRAG